MRFYGGVEGSIGGNALALELKKGEKSLSYFFDFGVNLESRRKYIELRGEPPETLEEYQRSGFLPELEKTEVRACFVSHGHTDHYIALKALVSSAWAPQTIWSSKTTKLFLGNLESQMRQFALVYDPFERKSNYYDQKALEMGDALEVGPFPVDHSVPGSCAYIIETRGVILLYTGDFRCHGPLTKNLDFQFWDYVKKRRDGKKLILLTEGTNFGTAVRHTTEESVKERLRSILKEYSRHVLVIVITEKDMWRLSLIQEVVQEENSAGRSQRRLLYAPSIAKQVNQVSHAFRDDYGRILPPQLIDQYFKRFVIPDEQRFTTESLGQVIWDPSKFLIVTDRRGGFKTCDMIVAKLKYRGGGGACILSLSEIFEEEAGISTREYARTVAELGFNVEELHSSGHVFPSDLVRVVKTLQPDEVYLMHTLAPGGLRQFLKAHLGIDAITPEVGRSYVMQ